MISCLWTRERGEPKGFGPLGIESGLACFVSAPEGPEHVLMSQSRAPWLVDQASG